MSMFEIVFSPTGGTEKVSGLVTGALDGNIVTVDLTDSGLDFHGVSMAKGDVAVISVPSYAGRVPAVAVERLGMVRGTELGLFWFVFTGAARLRIRLLSWKTLRSVPDLGWLQRFLPLPSIPLLVSLLLGDRMRRMWRNFQSLRSESGKSYWTGLRPSPLFPAIVLISKLEATVWCPMQRRIASPAVLALRCALFELSTRTIQGRWMARRASPACVASPYARRMLANLTLTNLPPLPRC